MDPSHDVLVKGVDLWMIEILEQVTRHVANALDDSSDEFPVSRARNEENDYRRCTPDQATLPDDKPR
jgi:hypothetical protein